MSSSSSSISNFGVDSGFSSTSYQAAGRVVEDINRSIHFAASSTTISISKNKASIGLPSSDESLDIEAEEQVERAEENCSLRRGYEWVDYSVRDYFSQCHCSLALHIFLSNISIYSLDATKEVIFFRRCRAIDNDCHGRESKACEFFMFMNSFY